MRRANHVDDLGLELPYREELDFESELESSPRVELGESPFGTELEALAPARALPRRGSKKPAAIAPKATTPPGGRLVVEKYPPLSAHRGTSPDLILRWNELGRAASVDVVVHFHGYSGRGPALRIDDHKEAISGLDFVDPRGTAEPGRIRPTVAVLPRGNHFGGKSGAGFNFPALTKPGAVRRMVSDALGLVGREVGRALSLGRLILTGHSGGGAPVSAVLADVDPDEVYIFDGTYGTAGPLVRWAERRIRAELGKPGLVAPALRVLYRPGTQTAKQAALVTRSLCKALKPSAAAPLRRRFRVDATRVGHNEIPGRFGWRLLADAGADLPDAKTDRCAGHAGESQREEEGTVMTEQSYDEWHEDLDASDGAPLSGREQLAWLDYEEPEAHDDRESAEHFEPAEEDEALELEGSDESFEPEQLDDEFAPEAEEEQAWEEEEPEAEGTFFEDESGLTQSGLTPAEKKAVEITSTLETGKRGGFYGLSGNFDGQGLSFGLVNWTIGTGSLQPLLRDFAREHPARWAAAFGPDAMRFLGVITPKGDAAVKQQHRFAVETMNSSRVVKGKKQWAIREPWVTYFKRLSEDSAFQQIQIRYVRTLLERADYFCRYFGLRSETAFTFMFDAVSSHGKWWLTKQIRGTQLRRNKLRAKLEKLKSQFGGKVPEQELLLAIADVLGETSAPRWAAKVRERKRWFITGEHRRAKELSGLEPRLDVAYTTSAPTAGVTQEAERLDEAFEPTETLDPVASFEALVSSIEEESESSGGGLVEQVKGVAAFVMGPTLQRGGAGPGVATLQRCLVRLGYSVSESGVFDAATERAVKAFQGRSGLTADGVVGPRTKSAIAAAAGASGARSSGPLAAPAPAAPASNLADAIVATAEREYRRWHAGKKLKETDRDAAALLQQYYREGVKREVTAAELQDTAWQSAHPWSAVFISFVMRKAGAGAAFKYSAAHQTYVAAARRNRLQNLTTSPFWAYRVGEVAPQVGDLVCAARSGSGATYDNIGDGKTRATHCDVVTEVRAGSIRVVGGNVNQNVDAKILRTLPDGRLALDGKQARFFAIVRCRGAVGS